MNFRRESKFDLKATRKAFHPRFTRFGQRCAFLIGAAISTGFLGFELFDAFYKSIFVNTYYSIWDRQGSPGITNNAQLDFAWLRFLLIPASSEKSGSESSWVSSSKWFASNHTLLF